LHEQIEGAARGKVDMVRWLNYTSFDLIGDLTFGEPFDCLKDQKYHPWIEIIFGWMRAAVMMSAIARYPALNTVLMSVVPKKFLQMRKDHFNLSASKMDRRLAHETTRPDFVTYLLRQNDSKALNIQELHSNSEILILAGSETTATALSGCLYYLCLNPNVMQRLTAQIRTSMRKEEDIVFANILELEYPEAVLNETMRVYPPVPGDMPRIAPEGGAMVAGHFVPGGVSAVHSDPHIEKLLMYHRRKHLWLGGRLLTRKTIFVTPKSLILSAGSRVSGTENMRMINWMPVSRSLSGLEIVLAKSEYLSTSCPA
jgi:hypothetical protein